MAGRTNMAYVCMADDAFSARLTASEREAEHTRRAHITLGAPKPPGNPLPRLQSLQQTPEPLPEDAIRYLLRRARKFARWRLGLGPRP